ncbi:MAG: ROK family protein [Patescibacteria group bacterium]
MYLLLDIGGTKTRVAVSKDGKTLFASNISETFPNFQEGISAIKKIADSLIGGEKIQAIVCGIPGPLDKEKTKAVNAPHLLGWNHKPLKSELEKAFAAPAYLENDSVLAGLGEAVFGAGKEDRIVAYLTVSTGVGGTRIVDGKIDANTYGFEPGHQIIDLNGSFELGKYRSGDLEGFISGSALREHYGKDPALIDDETVWDEFARLLAIGINNVIVFWSPDVVIIGGSVAANRFSLEKTESYLKQYLKIFPVIPPIRQAVFDKESGLYGGLAYLRDLKTK